MRASAKIMRRFRRKRSIRGKVRGTAMRPRMTVFKSNRYTYVQVVNDDTDHTLVAVSNLETAVDVDNRVTNVGRLGEIAGERLKENGIESVVFDRNGYPYHGKVKAIADGARKSGILL